MSPQLSHRAVLYTYDMEPITVLQLSAAAHNYLTFHGSVTLPVLEPIPTFVYTGVPDMNHTMRTVHIRAELLRMWEKKHLMLFTHDEESALLLKSAFLPGQQGAVRDLQNKAFARGFLHALERLGS